MFYVYLLKSPVTDQIYIGYSADLKARLEGHRKEAPQKEWQLVYYEAYRDEHDARERERKLKSYGSALHNLKSRIGRTLNIPRV